MRPNVTVRLSKAVDALPKLIDALPEVTVCLAKAADVTAERHEPAAGDHARLQPVTEILQRVDNILMSFVVGVPMDFVRLPNVADRLPMDAVALPTLADRLPKVCNFFAHEADLPANDAVATAKDLVALPSGGGELPMVGDRLQLDADRPGTRTD